MGFWELLSCLESLRHEWRVGSFQVHLGITFLVLYRLAVLVVPVVVVVRCSRLSWLWLWLLWLSASRGMLPSFL